MPRLRCARGAPWPPGAQLKQSRAPQAPREEWIPSTYKAPGGAGARPAGTPAGGGGAGGASAPPQGSAAARQTLIADSFWGSAAADQGGDGGAEGAAAPPPAASKRRQKRPKLTARGAAGAAQPRDTLTRLRLCARGAIRWRT